MVAGLLSAGLIASCGTSTKPIGAGTSTTKSTVVGATSTSALPATSSSHAGTTTTDAAPSASTNGFELIASSADKAAKAKSARISFVISIKLDLGPNVTTNPIANALGGALSNSKIKMTGRIALDGSRGEFSMGLGALLPIPGIPKDLAIRMRMVDGQMYMDFGALMKALGSATGETLPPRLAHLKWMSVKTGSAGQNPTGYTGYLDTLRGASRDGVTRIGTDTIGGVVTTHYRATIDVKNAREQIKKQFQNADPKLLAQMLKGADALKGVPSYTVDVWLDAQGLPRQFRTGAITVKTPTGNVSTTVSMSFSDYGVDLSDITVPPASEVISSDSMGSLF